MKGIKRLVLGIMILCLILVGLLTPEGAYASNFGRQRRKKVFSI